MNLSLKSLRGAASLLSPGGRRGKLIILAFHRVVAQPDPLLGGEIDARRFREQLVALKQCFNVLPLGEACRRLDEGRLPARTVCLTFDDGYASNAQVALPLLSEFGLAGTFFVATGFLNGGRMFNDTVIETVRLMQGEADLRGLGLGVYPLDSVDDRLKLIDSILEHVKYLEPMRREEWVQALAAGVTGPLPDDLMMTDREVRALHAAGMEIGGHTVNHPILASIEPDRAREEMTAGRERLAALIDAPVESFAYPNGKPGRDYTAEHVAMLRQSGFSQAVSTAWGVASARSDRLQLPRVSSWDRDPVRFVARLVRAYLQKDAATV